MIKYKKDRSISEKRCEMRNVKILVVCGAGAGSSALFVLNVERALESLGVKGDVESSGLHLVSAFSPDIVCCASIFVPRIKELFGKKMPIVTITSFVDVEGLIEKLKELLKELGYLK